MKFQKSTKSIVPRTARISEIAKLAGVGVATVDRVLNNRKNVRHQTRQRVMQAKNAIETGATVKQQKRPWRLKIFLPQEAGESTEFLANCFEVFNTSGKATIEVVFSTRLEPAVLARRLRACADQGIDAVGFQALDDPRVRSAIDELAKLNILCVPILSSMVSQHLPDFIGIDNMSAGKTAGFLMGRMVRQAGPVALVSGGELYRVHTDREMGFRTVLRKQFRHLHIARTISSQDDRYSSQEAVDRVLQRHPDIVGIYNVGGGNSGIVEVLQHHNLTQEVTFIGHNLTPQTASYLLDGSMDIVVHQNLARIADQAVQTMIAKLESESYTIEMIPIEVITRENIFGSTFEA